MQYPFDPSQELSRNETLHPKRVQVIRRLEIFCLVCGVAATIIGRGLNRITTGLHWELGLVVIFSMLAILTGCGLQYYWSRMRSSFLREYRVAIVLNGIWLLGFLCTVLFGPLFVWLSDTEPSRAESILAISEIAIILHGVGGIGRVTRRAAGGGWNPALILVLTFVALITIGTLLLMLPRSRAATAPTEEPMAERFRVAFFTATSASTVTGLIVVPTGGTEPYWSRMGQAIILGLFQIGGLGIMTCGSFFAVAVGNRLQMRERVALRELFESNSLGSVRRLLFTIVGFTLIAELLGAVVLSGLWSDLPFSDQAFYSIFHSTSSFCNAGFSLTENSFVGLGSRWQIWLAAPVLIITGGLGFAVLYNIMLVLRSRFNMIKKPPLFDLPTNRIRLTLASKLVLITTAALLISGTFGYYLIESIDPSKEKHVAERLGEAWFQSVTFRTAGFNTVDHGELKPATKLFAVLLMFIGASPGSTGGGVKTIAFAIAVLALVAVLKGRGRVEVFGRTIPHDQVNRALAIMSLGMLTLMSTTLLLVMFESAPERFIDHLFEATSAFATVGVSTGITSSLSVPSQFVIILTMFLGRVGPLTLMLAMAGERPEAEYQYPHERITLG